MTRHTLAKKVKSGEYERIAPGAFIRTNSTDDTTAAWMSISQRRPEATLCLLTAASIHDLTDEIPTASNLAIPRGKHPIAVTFAPITWHRFSPSTFALGRQYYDLPEGKAIGLYSAKRTVVDLFALRHELGSDTAVGALKRWLSEAGHKPGDLLTFAKPFPKARPAILSALEVLL
jgi:predicted transcriptional regulator of viral defense system